MPDPQTVIFEDTLSGNAAFVGGVPSYTADPNITILGSISAGSTNFTLTINDASGEGGMFELTYTGTAFSGGEMLVCNTSTLSDKAGIYATSKDPDNIAGAPWTCVE
ncbi:MAG: hypothetical protein H6765_10530 [Candidatus Peribacteria bacterium]|nr:MAG: hypothetical protein H6765_10530 [Candidatus Peribacteria bacterium]